MKFLGVLAAFLLSANMAVADSYSGGWAIPRMGSGNIIIGDGDGMGLSLGSTDRYCRRKGTSYSKMNQFISSNYPNSVSWFVDEVCDDGYVRICVYADWGSMACSTYENYGWVYLD